MQVRGETAGLAMGLPPWGEWMMARAPDVEGLLAGVFKGTGLLQGGMSDYVMALAIACAFPVMRVIMDRHVYGVRSLASGLRQLAWATSCRGCGTAPQA